MKKNNIKICEACGITSTIDSDLMYNIEIKLEEKSQMVVCHLCYGLLKYLVQEKIQEGKPYEVEIN